MTQYKVHTVCLSLTLSFSLALALSPSAYFPRYLFIFSFALTKKKKKTFLSSCLNAYLRDVNVVIFIRGIETGRRRDFLYNFESHRISIENYLLQTRQKIDNFSYFVAGNKLWNLMRKKFFLNCLQ